VYSDNTFDKEFTFDDLELNLKEKNNSHFSFGLQFFLNSQNTFLGVIRAFLI